MLWWRIELDKSGSITRVEQVEAVGKGTALVAYVQASTKAEACTEAKLWHEKRKAKYREYAATRRALFKAIGVCSRCRECDALPGLATCELCRVKNNTQSQAARIFGQPRERNPAVLLERERANSRRMGRLQVSLRRVLRELDERGPAAFRAWVVAEIANRSAEPESAYAAQQAAE